MQQIVTSAVQTIGPAAGGGVSRTAEGTVSSAYATDDVVHRLDELQSKLQQGPCIAAAEHPTGDGLVHARDLGGRDSDVWPAFAPQAAAMGFGSLLSLQLSSRGDRRSALNLYAHDVDAFDEEAVTTATLFSLQAAILLHGVDDAENLRRALETRDLIGQAKGVLTERLRTSDEGAFRLLVEASQNTNMKLVDVARWLLDDARRTVTGPISTPSRTRSGPRAQVVDITPLLPNTRGGEPGRSGGQGTAGNPARSDEPEPDPPVPR